MDRENDEALRARAVEYIDTHRERFTSVALAHLFVERAQNEHLDYAVRPLGLIRQGTVEDDQKRSLPAMPSPMETYETDDAFKKRINNYLAEHHDEYISWGRIYAASGEDLDQAVKSLGLVRRGISAYILPPGVPGRLPVRDDTAALRGWFSRRDGFNCDAFHAREAVALSQDLDECVAVLTAPHVFQISVVKLSDNFTYQRSIIYCPAIEKCAGWEPYATAKDDVVLKPVDAAGLAKHLTADDDLTVETAVFLMPVRATIVRGVVTSIALATDRLSPRHLSVTNGDQIVVFKKKG